jgi:5'-nucleotidase
MVRKLLITTAALLVLIATPAAAQYPSMVVQPQRTTVGGTVTVTGQGCIGGETVVITLRRTQTTGDGQVVATVTAGPDGAFTATFTIPAGTVPGLYDIISQCGDVVQSQQIEVFGNDVTPTNPGGGANPGSLPRTGSNLNVFGLVGAGLLVAGGLFLLTSRKRRNAEA